MIDPDRIARLDLLVRRIWPAQLEPHMDESGAPVVLGLHGHTLLAMPAHPRAQEALEAALVVMAGEI